MLSIWSCQTFCCLGKGKSNSLRFSKLDCSPDYSAETLYHIHIINSLPNDKFLDWTRLIALADDKINLKTQILF